MKKIILLSIVMIIILTGCAEEITTNENIPEEENKIVFEKREKSDRKYITEEKAKEWFEELYQIVNLDNHEVYIVDDTLFINFWFNNNVKRQEIMRSKDYVMNYLVLKYTGKGAPVPYVGAVIHNYKKLKYTVFIDDVRVLEQSFSNLGRGNGSILIDYYENLSAELPSRIVKNEEFDKFARKIKFRYWGIRDIIFQQTFKGNVLSINIKANKRYKEDDISKILRFIEKDIVPKVDYLGIVLQIYSKGCMYYQRGYHNNNVSDQRYWFEEYWGNHDYFDFNNN